MWIITRGQDWKPCGRKERGLGAEIGRLAGNPKVARGKGEEKAAGREKKEDPGRTDHQGNPLGWPAGKRKEGMAGRSGPNKGNRCDGPVGDRPERKRYLTNWPIGV